MGREKSPDSRSHSGGGGVGSSSSLTRTLLVLLVVVGSVHLLVNMRECGGYEELTARFRAQQEPSNVEPSSFAALSVTPLSPPHSVVSSSVADGPPALASYTLPAGVTPLAELTGLTARTMIVSFASLDTLKELYAFWPPLEEHFLRPHQQVFGLGSNLNFTLFYEVFPQDTRKDMQQWIEEMKFVHVSGEKTENHGLMVYRSPGGVLLHTQPLALNLPEYIADDISLTHRLDWMKCGRNRTFTFPYVFYNTVFTYHIMRHPLLANYDYYMKIDTDIIFKHPSPHSLFGDMANRKCVWSHANIVQAWPNCQWRANAAMAEFSKQRNVIARSLQYPWCSDESLYFYGNFVIGYLGLLRSKENLDFMSFLFHQWTEGYFKHRWTDQAVWPKLICLFIDAPNVWKDPQICDYSDWRHKIFSHV
jgi:hypothetical protein